MDFIYFLVALALFIIPVITRRYFGIVQIIFVSGYSIRLFLIQVDSQFSEIFRDYLLVFWLFGSLYALFRLMKDHNINIGW